jgi:hypothetical protein
MDRHTAHFYSVVDRLLLGVESRATAMDGC